MARRRYAIIIEFDAADDEDAGGALALLGEFVSGTLDGEVIEERFEGESPSSPVTMTERVQNQWGFNSFRTQDGAELEARRQARPGTRWYIWKLADGTYDYSATLTPTTPGHPADLVMSIVVR